MTCHSTKYYEKRSRNTSLPLQSTTLDWCHFGKPRTCRIDLGTYVIKSQILSYFQTIYTNTQKVQLQIHARCYSAMESHASMIHILNQKTSHYFAKVDTYLNQRHMLAAFSKYQSVQWKIRCKDITHLFISHYRLSFLIHIRFCRLHTGLALFSTISGMKRGKDGHHPTIPKASLVGEKLNRENIL